MGAADAVIDAYRLAHYYGQPPDHFLAMPISMLNVHLVNTAKLERQIAASNRGYIA